MYQHLYKVFCLFFATDLHNYTKEMYLSEKKNVFSPKVVKAGHPHGDCTCLKHDCLNKLKGCMCMCKSYLIMKWTCGVMQLFSMHLVWFLSSFSAVFKLCFLLLFGIVMLLYPDSWVMPFSENSAVVYQKKSLHYAGADLLLPVWSFTLCTLT